MGNADELRQIMADQRWWKRIEQFVPWKLQGFTKRNFAQFATPHEGAVSWGTVYLSGTQYKQLLDAFEEGD